VKWFQAVRRSEEVQILRERCKMLCLTCMANLVFLPVYVYDYCATIVLVLEAKKRVSSTINKINIKQNGNCSG